MCFVARDLIMLSCPLHACFACVPSLPCLLCMHCVHALLRTMIANLLGLFAVLALLAFSCYACHPLQLPGKTVTQRIQRSPHILARCNAPPQLSPFGIGSPISVLLEGPKSQQPLSWISCMARFCPNRSRTIQVRDTGFRRLHAFA